MCQCELGSHANEEPSNDVYFMWVATLFHGEVNICSSTMPKLNAGVHLRSYWPTSDVSFPLNGPLVRVCPCILFTGFKGK